MTFEIKITKENAGISPKGFLKKQIDLPFFKIVKLIKNKRFTINGKKIKPEHKLQTGDIIKCWLDDVKLRGQNQTTNTQNQQKKNLGIETIYEDDNLLVLNKEPNIIVQGAQDNENSLSLHLQHLKHKNHDNTQFNYFHVHRLDKDTSGVLVCAKNQIALRELNQIFRERQIKKTYLALCDGQLETPTGTIQLNLKRNEQNKKEKMSVVKTGGKKSISHYKLIQEYEFKNETISLVEITIETGLTHQIRVHLKHLGHPIIQDQMYGNNYINKHFEKNLKRQFLHAKSLEFDYKNIHHNFQAKPTKDLQNLLNKLKKL